MWNRLPLLLALVACGSGPDRTRRDLPPTTGTAPGTTSTTLTTVTTDTRPVCANPGARLERAFDEQLDPVWLAQDAQDTTADEFLGSGLAVADVDGDGRLDVFLPDRDGARLLLGTRDGWSDATGSHLPADDLSLGAGATAVDLDGDGAPELYLARDDAPDVLLRNDGSGRFTVDVDFADGPVYRSMATSWADIDGDGDLDGFVANTGASTIVNADDPNLLWLNDGGRLVAGELPEAAVRGHTLAGGMVDLDGDGDTDLYAVNDFGWIRPNRAALATEQGWEEAVGVGLDIAINGMGLAVGDLNDDGIPDFGMTGWDRYALLLSVPGTGWVDASTDWGLQTHPDTQDIGWGLELGDLDNDGDEDLVIPHGYIDGIGIGGEAPPLEQDHRIFAREGEGFVDRTADWGYAVLGIGRGLVLADLNEDGWLDVVHRDKTGLPRVHLARCGAGTWLRVGLEQDGPNTHAVGAEVRVRAGDQTWRRWVRAGGTGFASSGPPEVHVGLGAVETVELEVRWPDGVVTVEPDVQARQRVTVRRD